MPVFSPPLVPDSDEAREWAREELQRSVYNSTPSVWEWLKEKFFELIDAITNLGSGLNAVFLPLMVVGIIAIIIILAFLYGGPVRRRRETSRTSGDMWEGEDARGSQELRAAAAQAAESGDYSSAVLEQFRAIVRSLEERSLIEATQGMTAGEVGRNIRRVFPGHSAGAQHGAQVFDRTLYGGIPATAADYSDLRELDRALATTSDRLTGAGL